MKMKPDDCRFLALKQQESTGRKKEVFFPRRALMSLNYSLNGYS